MHHLAQINIGRLRGPLGSAVVAGFEAGLDAMNALAEASPGFVWRLQDEGGDATQIALYDDPLVIVNVSVWESVDALRAYAYDTAHRDFLRRRREWFERMDEPHLALWWVPAGHLPTGAEARDRLAHLAAHGPSARAFTFVDVPPPPEPTSSPGIRKTVGEPRDERPLQTLERLWRRHRALGLPINLPDDHVRATVGGPLPRRD